MNNGSNTLGSFINVITEYHTDLYNLKAAKTQVFTLKVSVRHDPFNKENVRTSPL